MENEIPSSWVWTNLGTIADTTRRKVNPQTFPDLPFVGMEDVEANTMRILGTSPAVEMKSSAESFSPGDVLYGRLRPYLNKVFRPDFEGLCSSEFIPFRKSKFIESKYIQYFLNSSDFVAFASSLNAGDRPRVDFSQLAPYRFPLSPLEEQKRIVSKIEELFSQLETGVNLLQRARDRIRHLRQAVLQSAVTGELTREWREEHQSELEPASALLERIRTERRRKWEEDLRAKGKDPSKVKYEEIEGPDTSELPTLPGGWVWVSFNQIIAELKNGFFAGRPSDQPPGIPLLRINAVRSLLVDTGERRYISENEADRGYEYYLKEGDLLFTRYNGSPNLVGVCGMVRSISEKILYPDKLIRVRLISDVVCPNYLEFYFSSEMARGFVKPLIKSTAGQHGIAGTDIKNIFIPLPPLEEQYEIVSDVERHLSTIEAIGKMIGNNLRKAESVRKTILSRAFKGELIAQDPNDEPASELLKRIETGRAEEGEKGSKNGQRNRRIKQPELFDSDPSIK